LPTGLQTDVLKFRGNKEGGKSAIRRKDECIKLPFPGNFNVLVWDGGLKDSQENMGFMQEVGFHLNK
jgi:hypothetical protein